MTDPLGPSKAGAPPSAYGVKLVRGPFVKLPPHPDSCESDAQFFAHAAALRSDGHLLAADLFSGAGGLSLGLERAGLAVVLSVDHDAESVLTHRHHFGGLSLQADLSDPATVTRVGELVRRAGVDVLAGGPPCQPFSKAGRSGIRHRVRNGLRDAHDRRRDLWQSFLEIVRLAQPRAVLMENVPDMALDKDMFILRTMVEEFEQLGYAVEEQVVDTWRYGVPQFRQRLILVALRDGLAFEWPAEAAERVNVKTAIDDLPEVRGGWRPAGGAEGFSEYAGPRTEFQRDMRRGSMEGRVYDHITRPVRPDDEAVFNQMTSKTRYSDIPQEFKRYRDDIFDDKYKRLDENGLSRTITAHIAKDGYWYIHPTQNRTLTVREAARLQTFPDFFRFNGPPSAAFRQIGNAVPPRLGEHLGRAVIAALDRKEPAPPSSREVSERLATWFRNLPAAPSIPWLTSPSRWHVAAAELVLERSPGAHVRAIWPVIQTLPDPQDAAGGDDLDAVLDMAGSIGREDRGARLAQLADVLREQPGALDVEDLGANRPDGLAESIADLVSLVVPVGDVDAADEPVLVTRGVLRVAARYTGDAVDRKNKLTAGRLAVARLIGGGKDARPAHLALIEIAASRCRPERPLCGQCPLADSCPRFGVDDPDTELF